LNHAEVITELTPQLAFFLGLAPRFEFNDHLF